MGNLFDEIGTIERLAIRNILLKVYVISLMYPYFALWKRERIRMSKTAVNRNRGRCIDSSTFTSLNSTLGTPEKGLNYVQS